MESHHKGNDMIKNIPIVPGILLLLLYENIIVIIINISQHGTSDLKSLFALLLINIFLGYDIFIRPHSSRKKDEYTTWVVGLYFVISPLLLGLPWIEHIYLTYIYLGIIPQAILFFTGLALLLAGGVLLVWSRRTLGLYGSTQILIQDTHQLIMKGPYHYIRNPIYLGMLLLYIGFTISIGSLISMFISISILFPLFIMRIRKEEELLRTAFGDEYTQWVRRTWRLVPYVW